MKNIKKVKDENAKYFDILKNEVGNLPIASTFEADEVKSTENEKVSLFDNFSKEKALQKRMKVTIDNNFGINRVI